MISFVSNLPKVKCYMLVRLFCIQKSLSVAKAMDPAAASSCDKAKFLIHADLLYEIVLFGLADKNTKVTVDLGLLNDEYLNIVLCY